MARWLALVIVVTAFGSALLAAPGVQSARAQTAGCPQAPKGLSPGGGPQGRFTMLIRVNQPKNAAVYANRDVATGGLGNRIGPQDVFVVNTRFRDSTPAEWQQTVDILRQAFPCNRVATLNGLGGYPDQPGYANALGGSPGIWAVLTDWERDDWNSSRPSSPGLGPWTGRFRQTQERVRSWIAGMTGSFSLSSSTSAKRIGLVPQYRRKWDYGALGRAVSGPARRLGRERRGIQSVQTQDFCAGRGGAGMKVITRRLLRSYKSANFKPKRIRRGERVRVVHRKRGWRTDRRNLGVQVSFSHTPNPAARMAVLSTSPDRAAACTRSALRHGAGAILYWASPDAMRILLSTPVLCGLRPLPGGGC